MILKSNIIYERFVNNYFYGRFIAQGRMMSTLMHPNILGAYFIGCIPLAFYFYKNEARDRTRYVNLAIFLFILSGVFLTFSRGTWFACLIMISIVMFSKKRVALSFSLIVSQPFISENLKYRFGMEYLWEYLKNGHRTIAYIVTAKMIEQHPFVGVGLSHYRMLFDQYLNIKLPREVMIPDSIYLMHLAEAGLLGFTGFIIFLTSIIKKGFYCCRNLNGDFRNISFAMLVGFTALLFNMAFFDGFLWKTSFYLFWLFAGILSALYKDSYSSTSPSYK
ncbi:MAG: O-antigen ligase family protein [Candidatus Staskawiczbacteria bacterium]|nr:O-antigen ligase family protein [Candidatus Staskawiczbacteria bacterium]